MVTTSQFGDDIANKVTCLLLVWVITNIITHGKSNVKNTLTDI